jgi:site-specific DNA-methyltransferase (adenine-specific)
LVEMKNIPDKSVDMILADWPYGTTACKWDSVIPLAPLWAECKRVIKTNGVIVLTSSQPFTTKIIASNLPMFRYCFVWEKEQGVNFQLCKKQPLKKHEDICIYYKAKPTYNPQGLTRLEKPIRKSNNLKSGSLGNIGTKGQMKRAEYTQEFSTYPTSILKFNRETGLHPTQKPVALLEYLIRTYTNEGETVLDNTMGSGSTLIACMNTGRNGIGIEKDPDIFQTAKQRIEGHTWQLVA